MVRFAPKYLPVLRRRLSGWPKSDRRWVANGPVHLVQHTNTLREFQMLKFKPNFPAIVGFRIFRLESEKNVKQHTICWLLLPMIPTVCTLTTSYLHSPVFFPSNRPPAVSLFTFRPQRFQCSEYWGMGHVRPNPPSFFFKKEPKEIRQERRSIAQGGVGLIITMTGRRTT